MQNRPYYRLVSKWPKPSLCMLLGMIFIVVACSSHGPRHIPRDRFSYNKALAESTQHQMLLNFVRIRYLEEPVFLSVSSILTQYVYEAGVGVGANVQLDGGSDEAGADANVRYEERPTITYVPIEGREFSEQMLTPIPSESIFAAAQQGWSVDVLLRIGLNRIGAAKNMAFEGIPPPGIIDLETQLSREADKLKRFQRVIDLLILLADVEAFEVRLEEREGVKANYLLFVESGTESVTSAISELKERLGLSPDRNAFRITDRITDIGEDEIAIQTRSLAAMMTFMAKGVQVPDEHLEAGMAIDYRIPASGEVGTDLIPFRMTSSKEHPKDSFAAVRYRDHWYFIDNRDLESRRALGLVISIFRLLAPSAGRSAPVLSLPAG